MKDIVAILLAAGRGTRMKSDTPKVLHELLGKPMILHLFDSMRSAGVTDVVTVTGYGGELLKKVIKGFRIVAQKKLLGSGDAVNTARKALGKYSGDILIIYGDTPLIKGATLAELIAKHKSTGASATVLTAVLKDPSGYGRVVRNEDSKITKIVEDNEARFYEEVIEEINVGTYCFKAQDLFAALAAVKPDNKKKEYYLTDAIEILYNKGRSIESVTVTDTDQIIGVNTRIDLARATGLLKNAVMDEIMASGVTIEDPSSTIICPGAKIGRDTVIYSNTVIESDVVIGQSCRIGPFARLRPGVVLSDKVEIGNFVELVRTRVGAHTKIKHHTYLGDAVVGKDVNIGAGTITANFDGKNKSRTEIEDGAFVGVGAILIAPVKIGKKATVGAGAVVPKNHNVGRNMTVVGIPARVLKNKGNRR